MTSAKRVIAARYQGIKTFVTLISARTSEARLRLAHELKVYEYRAKPFEAEAIEAILHTFRRITQPTRALIVDDSATVRRMIQRILANCSGSRPRRPATARPRCPSGSRPATISSFSIATCRA